MAIRKIARMGHPVLLQRAAEVENPADVQDLIEDMAETLIDSGGMGLACAGAFYARVWLSMLQSRLGAS